MNRKWIKYLQYFKPNYSDVKWRYAVVNCYTWWLPLNVKVIIMKSNEVKALEAHIQKLEEFKLSLNG